MISVTDFETFKELVNTLDTDESANINWTFVCTTFKSIEGFVRGEHLGIQILVYTTSGTITIV